MRQYLTLNPWVFFPGTDPSKVFDAVLCKEVVRKYNTPNDAFSFIWRGYGAYLLTANEVPLEVCDSIDSILREFFRYPVSDGVMVRTVRSDTYELTCKGATLYLVGTADEEVFLSFVSPWSCHFQDDRARLDLTGYGRTITGSFLAALLESLDSVRAYVDYISSIRNTEPVGRYL